MKMTKLSAVLELAIGWILLLVSALVAIAAPVKSTPESWPTNTQLLIIVLICCLAFIAGWKLRRHANQRLGTLMRSS